MNAIIEGSFKFPISRLTSEQLESFKSSLSYSSPYEDKKIELYTLDETYIGLPIEWVLQNYPSLYRIALDQRVTPVGLTAHKRPDPYHPNVKDPVAYIAFIEDIKVGLQVHNSVLAYAPTGTGKTVCALSVAAELGLRTLVLVHTEDLRDQWIKEIQDKLGIPRERIGIIQQDKCEIEGKDIVVSLLQTQARRNYDPSVYNSFGFVVVDECHKLSTEFFADVLPRFSAKYRLGLSATPTRKDGSDVVLYSHLGPVRVRAANIPTPIKIIVKPYYTQRKLWGMDEQQRVMCLTRDPDRNNMIIEDIKLFYTAKRNTFVVSHSVAHLEHLIRLSIEAGIPKESIGLYTATKQVYDPNYEWKVTGRKKVTKAEKELAATKQIIFIVENLTTGLDIPRMDSGIDAVPFWNADQRIGRVRRYLKGKLYPKWITYRDMKCEFSSKMYEARVRDYLGCEAELVRIK